MSERVMGVVARTPRPTGRALIYIFGFFAVPLIALLAVIDLLLYLALDHFFGICYGISCLF